MREFIKGVLILAILLSVIGLTTLLAAPGLSTWHWRWPLIAGCVALGCGSFILFLQIHLQRDLEPDFLSQHTKKFFDHDGFCFAPQAAASEDVCYWIILFQNRYDQPSRVTLAMRPARGFFSRSKIVPIHVEIECEPAGFGVAHVPWEIPEKYQGSRQRFEVGASVQYPKGKGTMVRFKQGIVVRMNAQFQDSFGNTLSVMAALSGMLLIKRPATVDLRLPKDVHSSLPGDDKNLQVQIRTLWPDATLSREPAKAWSSQADGWLGVST